MESAVAITESHPIQRQSFYTQFPFKQEGAIMLNREIGLFELNQDWGSEDTSDQSMVQDVLGGFKDLYPYLLRGLGELGCK